LQWIADSQLSPTAVMVVIVLVYLLLDAQIIDEILSMAVDHGRRTFSAAREGCPYRESETELS
jgi:hypothetical protein